MAKKKQPLPNGFTQLLAQKEAARAKLFDRKQRDPIAWAEYQRQQSEVNPREVKVGKPLFAPWRK